MPNPGARVCEAAWLADRLAVASSYYRQNRRKADAERFRSTTEVELGVGDWVDPRRGRITLREWVEQWWATTVDLRPSSRARDEAYLRSQILPAFGDLPLAAIDHLAIRAWVADLSTRRKPATVHKVAGILQKVLGDAVDSGLIARNPAERVRLPRIERREMRFLTPAQVADLADAIDRRYRVAVILGAYGGLRAGELFGLRAQRVDPLHQHVQIVEIATHVRGHLHVGPPKTRASHRTVPIPKFVAAELAEHLKVIGARPDDLVFPAPQGGHVRLELWRRRIWTPAVDAAGLAPLRPHDLRHTAVALWIAAGASPKEIATRAGHTSVVTVLDRYGHLLPGHEDKVNDALDAMARDARPTLRIVRDDTRTAEIARDIRGTNPARGEASESETLADQGKRSGRWQTRTADLCRVNDPEPDTDEPP